MTLVKLSRLLSDLEIQTAAEKIGVSRSTLHSIERGYLPNLDQVEAIKRLFDLPTEWDSKTLVQHVNLSAIRNVVIDHLR